MAKAKTAKKAAKKAVKTANGNGDKIDRGKYKYEATEITDKDGKKRKVIDNGDRLSAALRGLSADEVIGIARKNGVDVKDGWKNLNEGMRRMAAGNALRAVVRDGKSVDVNGKKVASL